MRLRPWCSFSRHGNIGLSACRTAGARVWVCGSFKLAMFGYSILANVAKGFLAYEQTVWRCISLILEADVPVRNVACVDDTTLRAPPNGLVGQCKEHVAGWQKTMVIRWSSTPLFLVSVSNFAAGLAPFLGKRRLLNVQPP
jgi:hypothetical protein